jgi:hypothetical protein
MTYTHDDKLTKHEKNILKNWPPKGPNSHRKTVGGDWEIHGNLQLRFLMLNGLKPYHKLLDVGCGCLRGGVKFINYLNKSNYFGFDHGSEIIKAGLEIEVPKYKLQSKDPTVVLANDFDLSKLFGKKFDFMLSVSLFTHLNPGEIKKCLEAVMPLLGGSYFTTFNKREDKTLRHSLPYPICSSYPFSWFKELADDLGINVRYIGGWGHPGNTKNNQMMMAFSNREVL